MEIFKSINGRLSLKLIDLLIVVLFGITAALLVFLLDFFPYDNIWTFSSFSSKLGFWIFTTAVLVYASKNPISAGVNSFIYLTTMTVAFYSFKCGQMYLRGATDFLHGYLNLGSYWIGIAFVCGIYGVVLWFGKKANWFGSTIFSLPICIMIAEGVSLCKPQFIAGSSAYMFLFQIIFNFLFAIILFMCFSDREKKKQSIIIIVVFIVIYALFEPDYYKLIF